MISILKNYVRGSIIDHKLDEIDIAFFRDLLKRMEEWKLTSEILNEFENHLHYQPAKTVEDIKNRLGCIMIDWDIL